MPLGSEENAIRSNSKVNEYEFERSDGPATGSISGTIISGPGGRKNILARSSQSSRPSTQKSNERQTRLLAAQSHRRQ